MRTTPSWRVRARQIGLPLAATTAAAVVMLTGVGPVFAAPGQVQGLVFRDFGSDGSYTTGNLAASGIPNDAPLAGVRVRAYDASNTVVGSTVSGADGSYSVPAASGAIRIQFSFTDAQLVEGYRSGYHGTSSGTSTQFVQSGATDVNFAANVPEDYLQSQAGAAIAVHRYGNPETVDGAVTDLSSSVVVGWNASTTSTSDLDIASSYTETGSIYGLAYQKGTPYIYGSAILRAHTGLGSGGLGGIYRIDGSSGGASLYFDFGTVPGVDVGEADFALALGNGPGSENDKRGLTLNQDDPNHDEIAYGLVGTTGLGGMAISTDQNVLYVVNLHEKNILALNLTSNTVTEIALPTLSADERPFAITVRHNMLYVGIVDSAESTGQRADLDARVISTIEPTGPGYGVAFSDAVVINDLTFAKGASSDGGFGTPNWSADVNANHWNAWDNNFANATSSAFGVPGNHWSTYSQPLLSSITFDTAGNLIMGFLDRFSFQSGMSQYSPDTNDQDNYSGISSGGLYGAAPVGDGTYLLESNGLLGGVSGEGVDNNRGPGGGQFYVSNASAHANAFTGAVAAVPGLSNFLSTGYDLSGAWVSDAGWVPTDGTTYSLAQRIVRNSLNDNEPENAAETTAGFGKAGGLGGVAILALLAPVEIGNRVWYDADGDGLQDADEPGLPGVDVTLYAADGVTVITTTTTDATGNYYFSDLNPDTTYVVGFDYEDADITGLTAQFGITSTDELAFTQQNSSTSSASNDSDANPATGQATVELGGVGENDHTIDAGVLAVRELLVSKSTTGAVVGDPTFTVTVICTDFRGDVYSTTELSLQDGDSDTVEVPAGAECDIEETDAGDAIGTTYTVGDGAESADPVTGLAIEGDTSVAIVNEFSETPPPVVIPVPPIISVLAATGFLNDWMMAWAAASVLIGLMAVLVTKIRRRNA